MASHGHWLRPPDEPPGRQAGRQGGRRQATEQTKARPGTRKKPCYSTQSLLYTNVDIVSLATINLLWERGAPSRLSGNSG